MGVMGKFLIFCPNQLFSRSIVFVSLLADGFRKVYYHTGLTVYVTSSGKHSLLRSKQCFPRSAFFICLFSSIVFNFCRMGESCFLQMLICDKKSRLWSDAAQNESDQSLFFLSLHKLGFPRWRHIYTMYMNRLLCNAVMEFIDLLSANVTTSQRYLPDFWHYLCVLQPNSYSNACWQHVDTMCHMMHLEF